MLPYRERMLARAGVLRRVRRFFDERGFCEVDTPIAVRHLAPEPHLDAPAVALRLGDARERRHLQTSPELAMKRVLAELPRIYQIAPAFRDGDFTPLHRPEFRILEWYRRDASYEALMADCEALLAYAAGGAEVIYRGRALSLTPPFRRVSVDGAFREHAGFSILAALERPALAAELTRLGVRFTEDDAWDDLFHRVFLERVEPRLLADPAPLFLVDYPAPLASLARLSARDARVAERFELYAGGLELANGFGELVDVAEQRLRFAADRDARLRDGKDDYDAGEAFFTALATLPPSAGIALGVERLLMLLFDARDLDEVAFLPWSDV